MATTDGSVLLLLGETEWSRAKRHTGRTDVPLTPAGTVAARALGPVLAKRKITAAFVSPARRARDTADLAGLTELAGPAVQEDPDLWEWDYGGYEGLSSVQVREQRPGWYLWRDGVIPGPPAHPGESVEQVGARADAVLARVRPLLAAGTGDVVLVAHGHLLRVLTARWLGLEPAAGRLFRLDPATMSTLSYEHDRPVLEAWNVPVA